MSLASDFLQVVEASRVSNSKARLFQLLDQHFKTDEYSKSGLKAKGISDETYGKESYIYVHTDSPDERRELENFLVDNGFKISKKYNPEGSTAEVRVAYFKGWHQDE